MLLAGWAVLANALSRRAAELVRGSGSVRPLRANAGAPVIASRIRGTPGRTRRLEDITW